MSRPVWFVKVIQAAFPTRFRIAAAARRIPWFGKLVNRFLFEGDDVMYLPKDNLIQIHQPVGRPEESVLPSEIAAHFVEEANHLFIMDTCLCREADDCEDYPIDTGCLFMGKAVHKINPKLGHHATREEAHAHLARARAAGLVHMIGRNRIDNVSDGRGAAWGAAHDLQLLPVLLSVAGPAGSAPRDQQERHGDARRLCDGHGSLCGVRHVCG